MPLSYLAHNAYYIVEDVSFDNNTGKSFDLLPKLLMTLKHSQKIDLSLIDRNDLNGIEFHDFIIKNLCSNNWRIENERNNKNDENDENCSNIMVIKIMSCLKDLNLNNEQLIGCLGKIMRIICKLNYSFLPPLILQLLMLGQKGKMILILKYIFGFFNNLDFKFYQKNKNENNNIDFDKNIEINLWREESQIFYHFHYISQQDHNIFNDLLKLIKNRLIKLDTFSFGCLLSCATIRRFKNKIYKFIINYISEYFQYNDNTKKSDWFHRSFITKNLNRNNCLYYSPIWTIFKQIIHRSIRGKWDQIIPSLIELGFRLLDEGDIIDQNMHFMLFMSDNNNNNNNMMMMMTQRINRNLTQQLTQHVNIKTESARQSINDKQLTQKQCIGFLGCYILKMLFFCQNVIQTDIVCNRIIDGLLQRIIVNSSNKDCNDSNSNNDSDSNTNNSNHKNNSNASLRLLQILTSKKPSIFMKQKILSKLKMHLEEIPNLAPLIGIGFIHSLHPIIELRPDFSDKIFYILRKALFSPKINIRILGVEGFISILQYTKTSGLFDKNNNKQNIQTSYSQRFGALACSQQIFQNPRQYLSMEIIGYLRRALNQQNVIRERVYFGLNRLINSKTISFDKILLFDLLLSQLKIYYVNSTVSEQRNIKSPIDFEQCFQKNTHTLNEPLPALIMLCCNLLYQFECDEYKFDELYQQKAEFEQKENDDNNNDDDNNDMNLDNDNDDNDYGENDFEQVVNDQNKNEWDKYLSTLPSNIANLFEIKLIIDDIIQRLSRLKIDNIDFEKPNKFENEPEKHGIYCGAVRYLIFGCLKTCCDYLLKSYTNCKNEEELKTAIRLIQKYHEIEKRDKDHKKEKKEKKDNKKDKKSKSKKKKKKEREPNSQESRILPTLSQNTQQTQNEEKNDNDDDNDNNNNNNNKNKVKMKIKANKKLTNLYFTLEGYLAGTNILEMNDAKMTLSENDSNHLLQSFMNENMLETLKHATKYLNETKTLNNSSTIIKKKWSPIIPSIVPYLGAVAFYKDNFGGISQLIHIIASIFAPLYKMAFTETKKIASKRAELAKPHHSDDSDDDDDDEKKKKHKPLKKLNRRMKLNEQRVECIKYMIDIALFNDNETAFKLLVNWNDNRNNDDNDNNNEQYDDNNNNYYDPILKETDFYCEKIEERIIKRHKWSIKSIGVAQKSALHKLTQLWSDIMYQIAQIMVNQYKGSKSALSKCISLHEDENDDNKHDDDNNNGGVRGWSKKLEQWFGMIRKNDDDEIDKLNGLDQLRSLFLKGSVKDKHCLKNIMLAQILMMEAKKRKTYLYEITQV